MKYFMLELMEPCRLSEPDRWFTKTESIVVYLENGAVIGYDLTDPRKPLPRFRSLVVTR